MMTRGSMAVTWVVSVLVAALFGWFAGIQNAARVASSAANVMMYLFAFAVIAIVAAAAWFTFKTIHHDDMNHPTTGPF